MNRSAGTFNLNFFIGCLVDTLLAISVLSLVIIPLALGGENKAAFDGNPQAQSAVRAPANPEASNSLEQILEAQLPATSVDFLMERTPSLSNYSADALPKLVPAPAPIPGISPITLEVLQGTVVEDAEEVAMLISEQCSQTGSSADGVSSCARFYSNGHRATVLTQNSNEGDEIKSQTVVDEFDSDGALLFKKTIRHRVDYNYLNDQKTKEKEFFDIIYQPAGKKITRELMVYEYFLDTGKAKSLSWARYKQIANELKAGLVYHAMLRYGEDGSPDRGIAEQWDNGKKAETFMNWSRRSKGFATLDEESWGQWESWIQNVSLQAYLP